MVHLSTGSLTRPRLKVSLVASALLLIVAQFGFGKGGSEESKLQSDREAAASRRRRVGYQWK